VALEVRHAEEGDKSCQVNSAGLEGQAPAWQPELRAMGNQGAK